RGHPRLAPRAHRLRRLPAPPADVPLQRRGNAVRGDRMGVPQVVVRKIDGEEILRRVGAHGVTLLCGAPRSWRPSGPPPPRRARGGAVPGRDTVRIAVAGAPSPSKTIEQVETELGWEFIQIYGLTETAPLLTINRRPAEWDDMDPAALARLQARAGVPAMGVQITTDEDGEILARSNRVFAGYWQQPAVGRGAGGGLVPYRRQGSRRDRRLSGHLGPQEGRDHLRRRERQLGRGRGPPVPAPGRGGGRGDRHTRPAVGRDGQGAGGAPGGPAGPRAGAHRALPPAAVTSQVPPLGRVARRAA